VAGDRPAPQANRYFFSRRRQQDGTAGSECHIALDVGEGHSPVILGEPGDEALLGVVTLEMLGLVFNPFTRTLQPMRLLLV